VNRSGHAFKASISRKLVCLAAFSIVGLLGIATAWASGSTEVKLQRAGQGRILAQQRGYTLYVFCSGVPTNCKKGRSSRMWPPMIAYHHPVAGPGIKQSKLGTKTINGKKIVTYYGQPLYRYKRDTRPGQTRGEAKPMGNGGWYVVTQFGQPQPKGGY
jgi:predicted lipoprotein with Yx(FWY)xxD motif